MGFELCAVWSVQCTECRAAAAVFWYHVHNTKCILYTAYSILNVAIYQQLLESLHLHWTCFHCQNSHLSALAIVMMTTEHAHKV